MPWGPLADLVLLAHFAFILFTAFGALLVRHRPWVAWLHLPALAWGTWIELSHGLCPLTPLENRLRELAGEATYPGDFIGHHLLAMIYPQGLTSDAQTALGAFLLAFNAFLYLSLRRVRKAHD